MKLFKFSDISSLDKFFLERKREREEKCLHTKFTYIPTWINLITVSSLPYSRKLLPKIIKTSLIAASKPKPHKHPNIPIFRAKQVHTDLLTKTLKPFTKTRSETPDPSRKSRHPTNPTKTPFLNYLLQQTFLLFFLLSPYKALNSTVRPL